MFLDSDDYLEEGSLPTIIDIIKNNQVDVILGDAKPVNETCEIIPDYGFDYTHVGLEKNKLYNGNDAIRRQLESGDMFQTVAYLCICNREYLINKNLWFELKLLHEDELWTPKVLLNADTVIYSQVRYYCYRIREGSIMRSKSRDTSKNVKDIIYIFTTLYKYYDWKISDTYLRRLIKDDTSKRYLHSIIPVSYTHLLIT